MSKKIGVLLSGCGHRDGSEIHETTCALLALDRAGVDVVGIVPDREQSVVVNHVNGQQTGEKRNMLVEAARIMRGNVTPISSANAGQFDALIIPGGLGAAMNLCSYGKTGRNCEIDNDVKKLILDLVKSGKPVGAICIAPVVVAKALEGSGVKATLTIGNDTKVAGDIESYGAKHKGCAVDGAVVDTTNKIVTTPAYMLATRITQVNTGISRFVEELLKLV